MGTKVIHEVVERIYHTRKSLPVARVNLNHYLPLEGDSDVLRVNSRQEGSILDVSTVETDKELLTAFDYSTLGWGYYSKNGGLESADYHNIYGNDFKFDSSYITPPLYSQTCPSDSIRTSTSCLRGVTEHNLIYGPYYRLLIPNLDALDRWTVVSNTKITSRGSGKETDISSSLCRHVLDVLRLVSFGGPNLEKTRYHN